MPKQPDLLDYPATPGWQSPETSIEAAEAVAPRVGRLRARVLGAVEQAEARGWGGLTADEAARLLDLDVLTARPRVCELRRMDLLHDSGLRRKNASGRRAIVWSTRGAEREKPSNDKRLKTKYERRKGR
ncbi:MAG: hypothetical protein ACE5GS_17620 [Kiloniellaceae bacterium]